MAVGRLHTLGSPFGQQGMDVNDVPKRQPQSLPQPWTGLGPPCILDLNLASSPLGTAFP